MMCWAVRVGVVLLVLGLSTARPLPVFVQKRSSPDEEIHFTEFFIAPPSVQKSSEHHPAARPGPETNDLGETTAPGSLTSSLNASEAPTTQQELPPSSSADDRSRTTGTGPDNCCFIHRSRRISKKYIASYFMTDSRCPKRSVVLITKPKKKEVCVDPNEKWLWPFMEPLDKESF